MKKNETKMNQTRDKNAISFQEPNVSSLYNRKRKK